MDTLNCSTASNVFVSLHHLNANRPIITVGWLTQQPIRAAHELNASKRCVHNGQTRKKKYQCNTEFGLILHLSSSAMFRLVALAFFIASAHFVTAFDEEENVVVVTKVSNDFLVLRSLMTKILRLFFPRLFFHYFFFLFIFCCSSFMYFYFFFTPLAFSFSLTSFGCYYSKATTNNG